MTSNEAIRVEDVKDCALCGQQGTRLYEGLRDGLFGAPGSWGFLRCPGCGLVWLNPRPLPVDLGRLYLTYYTHGDGRRGSGQPSLKERAKLALCATVPGYGALTEGWGWRQLARALNSVPTLKEIARVETMCLDGVKKGRLLDVGCGDGRFLTLMRGAGWEVLGVENDAAAAKAAQERFGVPVIGGTLSEARFPDESFDAVTLHHVIEHLSDPIGLLKECRHVVKQGGRVVVVTPNVESLAHQFFRNPGEVLSPHGTSTFFLWLRSRPALREPDCGSRKSEAHRGSHGEFGRRAGPSDGKRRYLFLT